MTNILVIGGAGYIGSHIALSFIDRGDSVFVFDNLSFGSEQNIHPNATFIKGDILNKEQLSHAFKLAKPEAIIHLAGLKDPGNSMIIPEKYSEANLIGVINILNTAIENNVKYVLFSSSASVYGDPQYIPIDERHPTNPLSYYGFTKLETEEILKWYDSLKGIKFVALRYFNAAGYDPKKRITQVEKKPSNLIPIIMEVALGKKEKLQIFGDDYETPDGTCVRDYIHVTDIAEAHIKAFEYLKKHNQSLILNLGTQKGFSINEILNKAREITQKPIHAEIAGRRKGDPAVSIASSEKAKLLLGWIPKHSDLDTLIRTTWEVYK